MLDARAEEFTNGIAAGKREYDILNSEGCWEEPRRTWIGLFEEDHFGSRATGEIRGVFEIYRTRGDADLDRQAHQHRPTVRK